MLHNALEVENLCPDSLMGSSVGKYLEVTSKAKTSITSATELSPSAVNSTRWLVSVGSRISFACVLLWESLSLMHSPLKLTERLQLTSMGLIQSPLNVKMNCSPA